MLNSLLEKLIKLQTSLIKFRPIYKSRRKVFDLINAVKIDKEKDLEPFNFNAYLEVEEEFFQDIPDKLKDILAISLYLYTKKGIFIFDSNNLHNKLSATVNINKDKYYDQLVKIEDGYIKDEDKIIYIIQLIYQLIYKDDLGLEFNNTSKGLTAIIYNKKIDSINRPILINIQPTIIEQPFIKKFSKINILKQQFLD